MSAASVSSGEVLVSLQGLEMVYVPTSPFYMGDGLSSGSYRTPTFGVLPSSSDLIGTNSNFVYTASTNSTYAVRAADRRNNAVDDGSMSHYWSSASGNYPAWWQVDFKSDRRILYLGCRVCAGRSLRLLRVAPGIWKVLRAVLPAVGSSCGMAVRRIGVSPVYLTQSSMQSG